ncbi:amidohydrolase [Planctomicrobium sp. SH664]|uniref:amidohydrolase n=1 Tax=Planctomicrobium sp. SH664 TaxID=3448125 RepID=UPI003F5AF472
MRLVRAAFLSLYFAMFLSAVWANDPNSPPFNEPQQTALSEIDRRAEELKEVSRSIWKFAEVGLEEKQSAALLVAKLRQNGFTVETGVSNMPTAFVATYGSGSPIIGILAEYDALPELSQQSVPYREPLEEGRPGHGCGHNLLGTASLGAGLALKEAMDKHQLPGTIRIYGTPAEETLIGKVYMLLDGQFDDLDACLHWHPGGRNAANPGGAKAALSVKFTFHGTASHASGTPTQGRSALDAVELMNVGTNYMREHITEDARLHYVITNGGGQPNIVPPEATVWYYIRANAHETVEENFAWVKQIAEGAALMTQTRVDVQIDTDCHEVIGNTPIGEAIDSNLRKLGAPQFTPEEHEFATRIQELSLNGNSKPVSKVLKEDVEAAGLVGSRGSTDVGDISWKIPTSGFYAVCQGAEAPGHSWQIVSYAGSSIGEKGALYAAKTLATTAIQLLQDADLRAAAKADFDRRMDQREYKTLIPEGQIAPKTIR